jgi:hypothetical protein
MTRKVNRNPNPVQSQTMGFSSHGIEDEREDEGVSVDIMGGH